MIFVTVGTHEQQFDRLIKYVDELNLPEEVMIQRGYSDYIPRNCRAEKLLPYEKMKQSAADGKNTDRCPAAEKVRRTCE